MIDKTALSEFIESRLEGDGYYLVDLKVSPANEIVVEIDSMDGVDIDYCVELSRAIEEAFPRDDEDYELEVGSAGLTSPFKVRQQFVKNIGNPVEVLTSDGVKLHGILREAGEETFTVAVPTKVKEEGMKRPELRNVDTVIPYAGAKEVKYEFK